jgi:transcriptional regulator with XRE-family HTH domain
MPVFGEVLAELRARERISQTELGGRIGYSKSMVGKWERCETDPPPRHVVEAVEEALDLSPGDVDRLLISAGYQPKYGTDGETAALSKLEAGELRTGRLIVDTLEVTGKAETADKSLRALELAYLDDLTSR